jgi:hypothetical protein
MKALDLVDQAMNAVLHRRTAMAIEMACKEVLLFVVTAFFAWHNHS